MSQELDAAMTSWLSVPTARQQSSETTRVIVKRGGVLGPRKDMGDVSEIMMLTRIVGWVTRTAENERERELKPTRAIFRSWHECAVVPNGIRRLDARGEVLDETRRAIPQVSCNEVLTYLSQDRPDIACVKKEVAKLMQFQDKQRGPPLNRAVQFCM